MRRLRNWLRVALSDLKGSPRRFGILIACLALGVATIAAVGSVGAALQGAIARDARAFLGGDIEAQLTYRPAEPGELALFKTLGTVGEVVVVNARATRGDTSAFLALRAVDDTYPLAGKVEIRDDGQSDLSLPALLAKSDDAFGAVVDRQLLDRLDMKVGDTFIIGTALFRAAAVIDALPDQAAQGFQIGVSVIVSGEALKAANVLVPGSLARYRYKILLNDGITFDAAKETIDKTFPEADWDFRSPRDAARNMSRFFDLFGRFLELVGLSSLLVGGVGVSNAANAYITERQHAIATLRSLGATGARLMVHFLAQIMVLAVVATLIGLFLGALTTIIALPILGGLLSLPLDPSVDLPSLTTAAGFGLLIAFAFAYLPLVRAQKLRPVLLFRSAGAAIAEGGLGWRDLLRPATIVPLLVALTGVGGLAMISTGQPMLVGWYAGGAAIAFVVLRVAAWLLQLILRVLPPLPSANLRNALKGISRPGAPTAIVVLSLGLGLSLLLLIALVEGNLRNSLGGEIATTEAPSFVMINMQKPDLQAIEAFAKDNPQVMSLDSTPVLRGIVSKVNGKTVAELGGLSEAAARVFRGDQQLSFAPKLPESSTLLEGAWWAADYSGPPLLSLSNAITDPLHLKLGDTMEILIAGRPITGTIANIRDIDMRSTALDFEILFSPGLIEGAPATYVAQLKAAEGAEDAVETRLTREFPNLAFVPVGDALRRVAELLGSLANAVLIVGGIAVTSGVLVLAGALAAGRKQRQADAVVMKVLGATRGDVVRAYLVEYGLLGALATLIAALLGSVAAWAVITKVLEIPFTLDIGLIVTVLIGAMAVTMATGLIATWSALSTRPAPYLRANE